MADDKSVENTRRQHSQRQRENQLNKLLEKQLFNCSNWNSDIIVHLIIEFIP